MTGEDEAFLRGIYLRQDREAAIKKKERGAKPGGLDRAAPRTSPPPAVSGSSGPCLLALPLPRFLPPLGAPAGPCQNLAGLLGEGSKALWVCPWRQPPRSIRSRNGVCCSRNPSEGSTEAKLKKESCPPGATGDATRAAGRRRRPPGFALRGSRELGLILSPAIEAPACHPPAPRLCFLADLDIFSTS